VSSEADAGLTEGTFRAPPRWATWEVFFVTLAVGAACILRLHDLELAPSPKDNWDEVAFAWSGLTLITRHVPYGWSFLKAYHPTYLALNGTTYPMVHPYLDHPPLFSLLIGGEAWLLGARNFADVTATMIRPVAVVLSTLSTYLAYVLGRRVLPRGAALVGVAILATAPVAVLFGRQVESENLLAPLLLLALILVHRLLSGEGSRWAMAGLVVCCVAASLTKVPGIAVGVACALLLALNGRWRLGLVAVAAGIAGLLLYAAYGALVDWQVFLAVLKAQSGRREGVMGAYEFIVAPAGIGKRIRDGWWVLGWLGLGALLIGRRRPPALLAGAALVFTATIMVLASESLVIRYGWYRIAVYPLVYVAAGYVCWQAIKGEALPLLAMLALGGAAAASFGLSARTTDEWAPSALVESLILGVLMLPSIAAAVRSDLPRLRSVAQAAAITTVCVILVLNIIETLRLADIYILI
jgi:4-amino-4-deoxy-L-arabinose transferase-like glycosyltransferase